MAMALRLFGFVLCLLAGLVAGYAARALWKPSDPPKGEPVPTAPAAAIAALAADRARLSDQIES